MTLKQLVGELTNEAERLETVEMSAPALTSLWIRGVATLFDRIEGIYLIDFLLSGQIKLVRAAVWNYAPRLGRFEVQALRVRVGGRHLTLRPEYRPSEARLGVVTVETESGEPPAQLELSLRGDGGWRWMAPAAPKGLRRLLRPLLPPQLTLLDEATFTTLLEKALLGPQPLFSRSEVVRSRLADLVDRGSELQLEERLGRAGGLLLRTSRQVAGRFGALGPRGAAGPGAAAARLRPHSCGQGRGWLGWLTRMARVAKVPR